MTSSDPTATDKAQLSQSWTDTLTRTLPKSSDSICISKVITHVVSASPFISFKLFYTKLLCHQSVLFFLLLMQTNPLSCLPSDILSLSLVSQHPGNTQNYCTKDLHLHKHMNTPTFIPSALFPRLLQ